MSNEVFANSPTPGTVAPVAQLSGNGGQISATATNFNIAAPLPSQLQSGGQFHALIDQEVVVIPTQAGTALTGVTRAASPQSVAAVHLDGASIYPLLTAESLQNALAGTLAQAKAATASVITQLGNIGAAISLPAPGANDLQVGTLTANATITPPTSPSSPDTLEFDLALVQNSTGGYTWSFSGSVAYPAGTPNALTAAGAVNWLHLKWDGSSWNVFPATSAATVVTATALDVTGGNGTRFMGSQATGVAPTQASPLVGDFWLDTSVPCFYICTVGGATPTWKQSGGSGGGGGVSSVTAADSTITVGGTATAPTVAVTPNTFELLRPAARMERTLRFISQSSAPIAQSSDFPTAPLGSNPYRIFHPVLFNAGRYLPAPVQVGGVTQNWYLYGSTDHDTAALGATAGGIYLWTAASLTQATWTPYGTGPIYQDATGIQTEYPSVVWDPDTRQLVMSYINHTTNVGDIAVSPDGLAWEKITPGGFPKGATAGSTEYTAYADMTRLGPYNWVATTLMGSGGYYLLWRSTNGINWVPDPRHTCAGDMQATLNVNRQDFGPRSYFTVHGEVWALGATKLVGSGNAKRDTAIIAAPVTADLRGWLQTPQEVWAPQYPWEMEGDYHDMRSVYTDETGALWGVYIGGNGQGIGLARGYLLNPEAN